MPAIEPAIVNRGKYQCIRITVPDGGASATARRWRQPVELTGQLPFPATHRGQALLQEGARRDRKPSQRPAVSEGVQVAPVRAYHGPLFQGPLSSYRPVVKHVDPRQDAATPK